MTHTRHSRHQPAQGFRAHSEERADSFVRLVRRHSRALGLPRASRLSIVDHLPSPRCELRAQVDSVVRRAPRGRPATYSSRAGTAGLKQKLNPLKVTGLLLWWSLERLLSPPRTVPGATISDTRRPYYKMYIVAGPAKVISAQAPSQPATQPGALVAIDCGERRGVCVRD